MIKKKVDCSTHSHWCVNKNEERDHTLTFIHTCGGISFSFCLCFTEKTEKNLTVKFINFTLKKTFCFILLELLMLQVFIIVENWRPVSYIYFNVLVYFGEDIWLTTFICLLLFWFLTLTWTKFIHGMMGLKMVRQTACAVKKNCRKF